ncbi:hypothetical protein CWS02_20240 [Enterobacter sp. EA-1]|nr:hypothetical protein CWS02_20240 [Enterobacter sp. EA-1]
MTLNGVNASKKPPSPPLKRFRWQAIVALLVGVPIMVWGMLGDNMMVTDANRSLWLVIGLVTFAVMVVAGGHFTPAHGKACVTAAPPWICWWHSARVLPPALLDERQHLAPVVPDGSTPSLIRSQRDDHRPD